MSGWIGQPIASLRASYRPIAGLKGRDLPLLGWIARRITVFWVTQTHWALRALTTRLGRHVVLLSGSSPRPSVDSASGRAGLAARPLPRRGQVTEKKARVWAAVWARGPPLSAARRSGPDGSPAVGLVAGRPLSVPGTPTCCELLARRWLAWRWAVTCGGRVFPAASPARGEDSAAWPPRSRTWRHLVMLRPALGASVVHYLLTPRVIQLPPGDTWLAFPGGGRRLWTGEPCLRSFSPRPTRLPPKVDKPSNP